MSESELEYRSSALKLEHRLHNIGQFIQFKAFRVVYATAQYTYLRSILQIDKSLHMCNDAMIIHNCIKENIFIKREGMIFATISS